MSELDDIQSATVLATAPQIEAEKSDEQKENENDQQREAYALAALSEHPGWKQIRQMFERDIDDFKSLKYINMAALSDKELGEAVRAEHLAASKLKDYLQKVDEAVRAVEDGRART